MAFNKNKFFLNLLKLTKFLTFEFPLSMIAGETSLTLAKLGIIEIVSQTKKLLSVENSAINSEELHQHNHESEIATFYYNHLKESLIGGVIFYAASTAINLSPIIARYKAYESLFGHSHPKLDGYFKSAFTIYDNAHTTAHIIDLLKTSSEVIFSQKTIYEAKHDALEHMKSAFEVVYTYYQSSANLFENNQQELIETSHHLNDEL